MKRAYSLRGLVSVCSALFALAGLVFCGVAVGAAPGDLLDGAGGGIPTRLEAASVLVELPTVTGLSPSECAAGSPAFAVTVVGSGFVPGAVVLWNGEPRDSAFVSSFVLIATVRAEDVAAPGTAYVSVLTPGATGGHSPTALAFHVQSPAPSIEAITPSSVWAGSGSFEITVDGGGYVPASTVQVAGVDVPTRFVSERQLVATVSEAVVRYAASVSVRVYTPAPGGGLSSLLFLDVVDDSVPPVTTATGLKSLWNRTAVTLTLEATDTGRGVEKTFYRVGRTGDYIAGNIVKIPAPSDHANDGLHVVQFFSIDRVLNWEFPTKEVEVGIDTTPPTTSVAASTVKAGGKLSPKYYVYDALSPRARDAVLQIVNRKGAVVQRCVLGQPRTRTWHRVTGCTVKLPRGTYKMRVLAHDLAGNAQSSTRSAVLTVK